MFNRTDIERAHKYEGGVSRRLFMAYAGALTSIPFLERSSWAATSPAFSTDPFTLGVASGDPDHQSLVLWTRLAPDPLDPHGGMKAESVQVTWEVASDETMKSIVASGKSIATPQLGHSVHVEVEGLKPDRWYWYRWAKILRMLGLVSSIKKQRIWYCWQQCRNLFC